MKDTKIPKVICELCGGSNNIYDDYCVVCDYYLYDTEEDNYHIEDDQLLSEKDEEIV